MLGRYARMGRVAITAGVVHLLLLLTGPAGGAPRGLEGVPTFSHVFEEHVVEAMTDDRD